jgi:hypothetical protein
MRMEMPMNVAPRGLPRWRILACGLSFWSPDKEVFRRKSCVIAMPMLAKEREVRSQARKVRSKGFVSEVGRERMVRDKYLKPDDP